MLSPSAASSFRKALQLWLHAIRGTAKSIFPNSISGLLLLSTSFTKPLITQTKSLLSRIFHIPRCRFPVAPGMGFYCQMSTCQLFGEQGSPCVYICVGQRAGNGHCCRNKVKWWLLVSEQDELAWIHNRIKKAWCYFLLLCIPYTQGKWLFISIRNQIFLLQINVCKI